MAETEITNNFDGYLGDKVRIDPIKITNVEGNLVFNTKVMERLARLTSSTLHVTFGSVENDDSTDITIRGGNHNNGQIAATYAVAKTKARNLSSSTDRRDPRHKEASNMLAETMYGDSDLKVDLSEIAKKLMNDSREENRYKDLSYWAEELYTLIKKEFINLGTETLMTYGSDRFIRIHSKLMFAVSIFSSLSQLSGLKTIDLYAITSALGIYLGSRVYYGFNLYMFKLYYEIKYRTKLDMRQLSLMPGIQADRWSLVWLMTRNFSPDLVKEENVGRGMGRKLRRSLNTRMI